MVVSLPTGLLLGVSLTSFYLLGPVIPKVKKYILARKVSIIILHRYHFQNTVLSDILSFPKKFKYRFQNVLFLTHLAVLSTLMSYKICYGSQWVLAAKGLKRGLIYSVYLFIQLLSFPNFLQYNGSKVGVMNSSQYYSQYTVLSLLWKQSLWVFVFEMQCCFLKLQFAFGGLGSRCDKVLITEMLIYD